MVALASLMLPLPVIPEISLAKAYCRFVPFCQGSKRSKTTSLIFSACAWWHPVFSLTKHLGDQPNACWIRIPWRTPVKHLHEYTLVCWLCPQTANTCLSRIHIASISVLITRAQTKTDLTHVHLSFKSSKSYHICLCRIPRFSSNQQLGPWPWTLKQTPCTWNPSCDGLLRAFSFLETYFAVLLAQRNQGAPASRVGPMTCRDYLCTSQAGKTGPQPFGTCWRDFETAGTAIASMLGVHWLFICLFAKQFLSEWAWSNPIESSASPKWRDRTLGCFQRRFPSY